MVVKVLAGRCVKEAGLGRRRGFGLGKGGERAVSGASMSNLSAVLTWLGWKWRRRSSIQRSLSAAERQEKQRLPPVHVTCW